MDVRPGRADAAEVESLVRDRLGAVVHQEDEAQGEQQQTDETEYETDHAGPLRAGAPPGSRLVFCCAAFNPAASRNPQRDGGSSRPRGLVAGLFA